MDFSTIPLKSEEFDKLTMLFAKCYIRLKDYSVDIRQDSDGGGDLNFLSFFKTQVALQHKSLLSSYHQLAFHETLPESAGISLATVGQSKLLAQLVKSLLYFHCSAI